MANTEGMKTLGDVVNAVRNSILGSKDKGWMKIEEDRADACEKFIRTRIGEYAEKLGLDVNELAVAVESQRDYYAPNYYQDATFPSLDDVRVFDTLDELLSAIPSKQFRCPSCTGVSTDPYECNSGVAKDGDKVCDWKAYGLFRTLGKGLRLTIRSTFMQKPRIDEIFMPLELENEQKAATTAQDASKVSSTANGADTRAGGVSELRGGAI